AIEQVSLNAGGMSAEYGQFRSGMIDVTTKTGTMDGYHGSFNFTESPAHIKRFGPSLFDPMNNYLRPQLDPSIAFIGVDEAVKEGIISSYTAHQFAGSDKSFKGWANITDREIWSYWKQGLKPGQSITPVDMYLLDAWLHTVAPDFNKLNSTIKELNAQGLNVGNEVTDQNLINLFKSHANKEGQNSDFNFDGGFGGPVPFLSKSLGNATFYLSNITNRSSYIEPLELNYDLRSSTLLTLKSNVTSTMTLKLTGLYEYHKGMNPARAADSEPATLSTANDIRPNNVGYTYLGLDRGAFMPSNNIPLYTDYGSNYGPIYYWYNTMLQPWVQKNYLGGFELNQVLSSSTYYTITGSYQRTRDDINPDLSTPRNDAVLGYAGPFPLTEVPYGRQILPYNSPYDTVAGWIYDGYYSMPQLSERFGEKGGVYYDNSLTQQLRLKFDFGSQINKEHFIKAGIEYNYTGLNNNRWSYWPYLQEVLQSAYEYNFTVHPYNIGAFVQDQITFENMIATIGVRADYYSFGDLKWPTGNLWDASAFGAAAINNWMPIDSTHTVNYYIDELKAGRSLVWDHWNALNSQYIAQGKQPLLQPVATHLVFSPRFGISFPISTDAKFYFNYGHFLSMPPLAEMLAYDFRFNPQKGGVSDLGNPNLAPSKTIQYELGVDYSFSNEYLLHIAGYYKDVTGDVRAITLNPESFNAYRYRINDSYKTIQGIELQITKSIGKFLTGWLNLQYTYNSSGFNGKTDIYQDPTSNATTGFIYANSSRPYALPTIRANFNLSSPDEWGQILGGWNLSILPTWRAGDRFTYNANTNIEATNYFYWPNYWNVDLKLSKTFNVGFLNATAYLNVNNLFNTKTFLYQYAFERIGGDVSYNVTSDFQSYMASLHLSQYSSSYYNAVRNESSDSYLYPGYVYKTDGTNSVTGISHKAGNVVTGEDHVGDLHSSSKPWINGPNADLFTYGYTRSFWFGIKFDF
ncbi:MAG TPA: TonB-dependent receptor, partial [Ignavibacteriaceae bacterium]|nr:TonB-dependent receptor [Ignavibacteriaceae bacterium]